jgi:invasion protein IalB
VAGSAFAQGPQRTTATYQDWMVRYEMGGHAKVCDMTQSTQLKAHSEPITQIAIGRQGRSGLLRIVFQVPINVWLPAGVKLTTADAQVDVTA